MSYRDIKRRLYLDGVEIAISLRIYQSRPNRFLPGEAGEIKFPDTLKGPLVDDTVLLMDHIYRPLM